MFIQQFGATRIIDEKDTFSIVSAVDVVTDASAPGTTTPFLTRLKVTVSPAPLKSALKSTL